MKYVSIVRTESITVRLTQRLIHVLVITYYICALAVTTVYLMNHRDGYVTYCDRLVESTLYPHEHVSTSSLSMLISLRD